MLFVFRACLCYTESSVPCSFLINEANLMALFVWFSCVFVLFPYDVPGHVWE